VFAHQSPKSNLVRIPVEKIGSYSGTIPKGIFLSAECTLPLFDSNIRLDSMALKNHNPATVRDGSL
jgi:hypothetical protein